MKGYSSRPLSAILAGLYPVCQVSRVSMVIARADFTPFGSFTEMTHIDLDLDRGPFGGTGGLAGVLK